MVYLAGLAMAARTHIKCKKVAALLFHLFSFVLLFCIGLLASLAFPCISFLCFFTLIQ